MTLHRKKPKMARAAWRSKRVRKAWRMRDVSPTDPYNPEAAIAQLRWHKAVKL